MQITKTTKCPGCGEVIKPLPVMYGDRAIVRCPACGKLVDAEIDTEVSNPNN